VLGIAIPMAAQSLRYNLAAQQGLEWLRFPRDAATYVEEHHLPGPIFNSYDNGGYLLWRLYPRYRVYIDGRTDLYGNDFMQNYLGIYRGEVDPQPEFDRFRVGTVLVEPMSPLATTLRHRSGWKALLEDGNAIIFTRVH